MANNIEQAIKLIKQELEEKTKEANDNQEIIRNLEEKRTRLDNDTERLEEALNSLQAPVETSGVIRDRSPEPWK